MINYSHILPVGTLVTCTYNNDYELICRVIRSRKDYSTWVVLSGGHNHRVNNTYGLPNASDPGYTNHKVYTSIEDFPYPELLL